MAEPIPTPGPASAFFKRCFLKAARMVLLGLIFGFTYDWAAPRLYHPARVPGFGLGLAHGALMPVALPALLMGKDVPIFAAHTASRIYKIGYIVGINLCGLVFFGTAFWSPAKPQAARENSIPVRDNVHDKVSALSRPLADD